MIALKKVVELMNDWDFKHIILNLEALKSEYDSSLTSFSYFNKHELVKYKREMKKKVYAINTLDWRKDKIWMYLNGDVDRMTVEYLLNTPK